MSRIVSVLVLLAIGAAGIVYSVFAHHLSATDDRSEFAYVFALGSLYFLAICVAMGSPYRKTIVMIASLAVLAGWWYHDANVWDPRWVYLLQHVGVNAGLALLFGLSLKSSGGSLVTRMARAVHGGELPPSAERYTRQVTFAWTAFFVFMGSTAIVLFAWGPQGWWSVFINFMSLPCVVLMFVIEYAVRRRLVRDLPHKGILESVRAYARLRRSEPR